MTEWHKIPKLKDLDRYWAIRAVHAIHGGWLGMHEYALGDIEWHVPSVLFALLQTKGAVPRASARPDHLRFESRR